MKEKKALGFNLKRLRQARGLTQKKLAEKVGLNKDTISKIEVGKQENIGLKHLSLICRELDISIEELFMEDANYISLKIVVSDKNIETLKNICAEFLMLLAEKEGCLNPAAAKAAIETEATREEKKHPYLKNRKKEPGAMEKIADDIEEELEEEKKEGANEGN